ncbi:hypothetical protein G6F63_014376 [Rhizopus arrhizus]|nr:hypothetical protein G6F63_014376 [Rhizopus arrhizus]
MSPIINAPLSSFTSNRPATAASSANATVLGADPRAAIDGEPAVVIHHRRPRTLAFAAHVGVGQAHLAVAAGQNAMRLTTRGAYLTVGQTHHRARTCDHAQGHLAFSKHAGVLDCNNRRAPDAGLGEAAVAALAQRM